MSLFVATNKHGEAYLYTGKKLYDTTGTNNKYIYIGTAFILKVV